MRFASYLFILIGFHCYSQNFQWVKQAGGNSKDYYPLCKSVSNGSTIVVWRYSNTTSIDSFKTPIQNSIYPFVVTFLNTSGKVKWIWKPDSCFYEITPFDINYSEKLSRIFIAGFFSKEATINKVNYKGVNNSFILSIDTNGFMDRIYVLSLDTGSVVFESIDITEEGEPVAGAYYTINNKYPNSNFSIPNTNISLKKTCTFILKLDTNLNPKIASIIALGTKVGYMKLNKYKNNSFLISHSFLDTFFIGSNKYYYGSKVMSSHLTKIDNDLKIIKNSLLYTCNTFSIINSFKSLSTGEVMVGGVFDDSISIIKKRFKKTSIPLLACFDSLFKIKWIKLPTSNYVDNISGQINSIDITENYIYAGGVFRGNLHYDNIDMDDSSGMFWFFKIDNRGNFLWMERIAFSLNTQFLTNISANNRKEVVMVGFINGIVTLNGIVYYTNSGYPDILIIKIHDIDILRGYVSPGPYCAGDTIKVPYTKNGDFNKDNQFIAQLSDEKGNFEGGERELGRITSDTDGVIKGILPMFDVQSSPHYRIRIISTSPVVQSYYKYDTLRLLIYSKDTANAGADTSICNGTSLKLTTSGGSLWHWSPGELTTDSILKTTTAFPDKTTKYRVIISDSSGCGKTDTAYKMVYLKPPLKIKGLPLDTHVCKNDQVYLKIKPNGGLGNNYSFEWLSQYNVSLGLSDTIRLKITSPMYVKAVLSDGCTVRNDTQTISIKYKNIAFSQLLADTLLCSNTETLLKLRPSDGETKNYFYYWYSPLNEILSNTDTLRYKPVQNTILKAIITNVCNEISDTSFVKITVPEAINNNIEKPSCFDSSLTLTVKATGGFKNILTHVWYRASKPIDIGKTLNLDGIKTKQKITVKSSDYCKTEKKDSIELIPEPKAIIKLSKDTICENDNLIIQNQSTSYTEIVSSINWENNKNKLQNKDTSITLKNTGLQYIKLNITDSIGCKASDSAKVQVIQNPEATFYITPQNPTVDNGSIELSPQNKEYTEYLWQIGNDLKIKHRYWSIVRLPVFDTSTYKATLIVKNKYACTDTVSQTIKIAESDAFYIPNAISNNNDGLNDEFAPYGWKVESYQMLIVARTNQVVYKGSTPWHPTHEEGVYAYLIKVKFKDGSEKNFKGLVHVLR
ncbi:MAG: gliding motility-associated C-terminal domain-containing protein [Bacteroidia bacterium]|nr:gliding motility-associated C-terminal domain-containing protein [Bacteroidia bacterium]